MSEKYILQKPMPGLNSGVIFELKAWSKDQLDLGNPANGYLTLAWTNSGNCQGGWCGGAYAFPGQIIRETDWFKPVGCTDNERLQSEIQQLKRRLEILESA